MTMISGKWQRISCILSHKPDDNQVNFNADYFSHTMIRMDLRSGVTSPKAILTSLSKTRK